MINFDHQTLSPGDEEQVYRNYRRVTCRAATARIIPILPQRK